jgi:hypothetical protein
MIDSFGKRDEKHINRIILTHFAPIIKSLNQKDRKSKEPIAK